MSSRYAEISLRWIFTIVVAAGGSVAAQAPASEPPPRGQDILAKDGDRIILEDDARIQIVRRRQATVRTIFNAAERFLILLADFPKPGELPDGRVDFAFNYLDLEGTWPLGERWEAFTTVEEYSATPQLRRGIGFATQQGLVQVLSSSGGTGLTLKDPAAAAVLLFRGGGGGGVSGVSFEEAEALQLLAAARRVTIKAGSGDGSFGASSTAATTSSSPSGVGAFGISAVRVVGSGTPVKIRDVAPVYPDAARQANVRGVVIVEIKIGLDGAVTDARILRSVPLLDQAALDAVRQWQYQPVMTDGKPVPVTLTVPIPFSPDSLIPNP
jgi:TonB family protein